METRLARIGTKVLQTLSLVFFAVMILVNFMANFLPLNGKTTGQVSAQYPNLFVPAPLTFSIWGVIYFALLIFCISQFTAAFRLANRVSEELLQVINGAFILTCIINICWIIAWHYDFVLFSVFLMLFLLSQLISLNAKVMTLTPHLAESQRFVLKVPFGLYLGWICIATIANITALLVSYGWRGVGMSEESWTSTMILAGAFIGVGAVLMFRNIFIGLSIVWALGGIIIARRSETVYYHYVELSAWAGIILVAAAVFVELLRSAFRKKERYHETTDTL